MNKPRRRYKVRSVRVPIFKSYGPDYPVPIAGQRDYKPNYKTTLVKPDYETTLAGHVDQARGIVFRLASIAWELQHVAEYEEYCDILVQSMHLYKQIHTIDKLGLD